MAKRSRRAGQGPRPWVPDPAGVFFSDRFAVNPMELERYGALDVSVVADLPMFVDPFLLFSSEKDEYRALHTHILEYLRFLRAKAGQGLEPGLIQAWYSFKEVKQNWLGFSDGGNSGHGLGRAFAQELNAALESHLSSLGAETVTRTTHLEKVALVREGVGRDAISDFTTNLIKFYLCEYTEAFAKKHVAPEMTRLFRVQRAVFDYNTETWQSRSYVLPELDGDYVLLTPLDMLTSDDTWINKSDMTRSYHQVAAAVPNEQLRAQFNNYLLRVLPEKPTARERAMAIAKVYREFPILVDYYIREKEDDTAGAVEQSQARTSAVRQTLVEQVRVAVADIESKTDLFDAPWTSLDEARDAVARFKYYIENQDGHAAINAGNGKPFASEKAVQAFFGLLFTRSRFDVNREPNNGRGPVDFKVSHGALDKTLIEFKLASSSSLKRNLQKQVAIYEAANRTSQSVTVILGYDADQIAKARRALRELELAEGPDLVVIDASADKPSASKV